MPRGHFKRGGKSQFLQGLHLFCPSQNSQVHRLVLAWGRLASPTLVLFCGCFKSIFKARLQHNSTDGCDGACLLWQFWISGEGIFPWNFRLYSLLIKSGQWRWPVFLPLPQDMGPLKTFASLLIRLGTCPFGCWICPFGCGILKSLRSGSSSRPNSSPRCCSQSCLQECGGWVE